MRIVAKIGTSSLTDERGVIQRAAITSICDQTAELRRAGHEVLLVSSGAVSAGVAALGLQSRPKDMPTLQALSAAGQSRLMEVYNAELGRHGFVAAQVLVVPPDFVNRRQYLHARQTLTRLLDLGCVPIVNENDAIASDEIRWGDNDRIAALLANLVRADKLVLLTDTDGLFTSDPRIDADARLIERVSADDPMLSVNAGRSGSSRGSGGMASKLTAARIASWSGVETVIARSTRPNVIVDAVAGIAGVGTTRSSIDCPKALDRVLQRRQRFDSRRRRRPARADRTQHVAAPRRSDRCRWRLRGRRHDRRHRRRRGGHRPRNGSHERDDGPPSGGPSQH
jgi:glutamate 5-kinase